VAEEGQHLGVAQDRFARDAAPVEADTAERVVLYDGRLAAKLSGADGGDVAARSTADDHDVVGGTSTVSH